jgi:virginiamycin B lyase
LLPTARVLLAFLTVGFLAACGKGTPITSGTATPAPTPTPAVTAQYPIPTASSDPLGIALGSDGNLWFTEFKPSKIGQLNLAGKISESVTPSRGSAPNGIASGPGPNLNVWFTENKVAKVGQITVNGPPYTEYTFPNPAVRPVGIALGADGNMWVTDTGTNSIWRVQQIKKKPFVKFTQFHLTGNAQPLSITNLPVSGKPLVEYPVKTGSHPMGIAPSTDNALWFIEQHAKQIARISVTGNVTAEYPLGAQSMLPDQLVQGIDGNFYFTDTKANKIGQFFFKSHRVLYYSVPTANSGPTALTLGNDSEVYFVETFGNKLAQFRYFNV